MLVNHAALHHKHNPPDGRDIRQRVAIKRDDVRFQARRNRADLIGHAKRLRSERVGGDHSRHRVDPAIAHAVNKILRIPSMCARHRIGAINDFQSRNAQRTFDKFLMRRDKPFHRREALFRVVRRARDIRP